MNNAVIRLAEREDTERILKIYEPFIKYTAVTFETEVPDLEDFWKRIEDTMGHAPWLVCEINGELSGYAYAGKHRVRPAYKWSRELSVYVNEDYREIGVAAGLYTSLIEILKIQGYANVLAGITLPNPQSVDFHEGFGFSLVGVYHMVGFKLGDYHDVGWWELALRDRKAGPDKIRSINEIYGSLPWNYAIAAGEQKVK